MSKPFLSEEDTQAISAAIARAETTTSGEIVFAVTEASGEYRAAALGGAVLGMAGATAVYLLLPISHRIAVLLAVQVITFLLSHALLAASRWRLRLVSSKEVDLRVREAAIAEFYGSGLYKTSESNGVLIFLSLLEHRVVVLGDSAVDAKLGASHWDGLRDRIIRGIREGKARDGIVEAVEMCGKALALDFPRRADDVNELSNRVIQRSPDAT